MKPKRPPNILITGTVGVGKSHLCERLSKQLGLQWLQIAKIALNNNFLKTFDEIYQCPILDVDKLVDGLEDEIDRGGNIIEYHSCQLFPEKWFDLVIVVRVSNKNLRERLVKRGYSGLNLHYNLECEMFQEVLEEALRCYKSNIVLEVFSNCPEDIEDILVEVKNWIENRNKDQQ